MQYSLAGGARCRVACKSLTYVLYKNLSSKTADCFKFIKTYLPQFFGILTIVGRKEVFVTKFNNQALYWKINM